MPDVSGSLLTNAEIDVNGTALNEIGAISDVGQIHSL
jgi:hypothetical protein